MCPLAKPAFWKQVCHRRLHSHTERRLDYGDERGSEREREKDQEMEVRAGWLGWVCCDLGGEPVSESEVSSPASLKDSGEDVFSTSALVWDIKERLKPDLRWFLVAQNQTQTACCGTLTLGRL